jgi:uncharacterized protein YyaL (SSP411 family)
LLQHAANPVHWWEWCDEAFAEAKRRDVPVFLSIGYSACHWCHVMAHESFEDLNVAEYLNNNFVSIKVDREERPDIDTVYMNVTTALTGRGGWPMSVFLDGEGRPFYAGTYFPPSPAHGMPSFTQLVKALSDAWRDDREQILNSAENIVSSLNARTSGNQGFETPTSSDLTGAVKTLSRFFDSDNGGFGNAPKFPPSMILEFLINEYARVADVQALSMAEKTLTAMARGGIYDQLGGGFARYSVDAKWVVPHFEKMLYDNALLLRVYTHWWRVTGSPLAQRVAHEIAEFMLRELRTTEGGFASAFDADSNGTEGAFYVWTPKTIHDVLGDEDGALACALLNVTASGTFEDGFSTLQLLTDPDDQSRWMQIKRALLTARELRPRPHLDDKVVASWNGLAIASLSEAGMIFSQPTWIEAAESTAELLVKVHLGHHGTDRLNRTSRNGVAGSNWGVLDDYANVAEGFLALYQVTGNQRWFDLASNLLDIATKNFADGSNGFFYTDAAAPRLVQRPKNIHDNAEPSGWFALAKVLITHSALTGGAEYRHLAEAALMPVSEMIGTSPMGVGWGLVAAQSLLCGPIQVAIIGSDMDEQREQFVSVAWQSSKPGAVIVFGKPNANTSVTLLKDRPMIDYGPTVYLCREFVCEQPTNDLATFRERLGT